MQNTSFSQTTMDLSSSNLVQNPVQIHEEPVDMNVQESKRSPMIVLVLDASGSMEQIANDIRGSVNSFIQQQKDGPVDGTRMSLIVFSDEAKEVFSKKQLADVKAITTDDYKCNGYTALYDAIGMAINHHSDEKDALVVIVTDGEENRSRMTYSELTKKIEDKKTAGWKFIYLANEPKVSQAGSSLGFASAAVGSMYSATNNLAVGYHNMAPALQRGVSDAVQSFRSSSQVPNMNDYVRAQSMPFQSTSSQSTSSM